jgi:hypothetical protein
MQRKLYVLFVLFVALAAMAFTSIALADQVEDPAENWCYAGGAWGDGRCTVPGNGALTEWYWTCGYYRAQVVKGTFSTSQIPQTCRAPVAPVTTTSTTPVVTVTPPTGTPPSTFTANFTFCTNEDGVPTGEPNTGQTIIGVSSSEDLSGGYDFASDQANVSTSGNIIILTGNFANITNATITITGVGTATLGSTACG